jgi:hypothetical protein
MDGFQPRWLTPPGKKRWRQEYRLAWDCFAVYDCDPAKVRCVVEGWWGLHGFRPTAADIKRVERFTIPRAFKFTDRLRAGREQKRQQGREKEAARQASWSWARMKALLDGGPKRVAELAACLQLKPDTVRQTLHRHKSEVERVSRGCYRLLTVTPAPNKDKKEIVLYKSFQSILGGSVTVGAEEDNSTQEECRLPTVTPSTNKEKTNLVLFNSSQSILGGSVTVGAEEDNPTQDESLRAAAEAAAGARKTLVTRKEDRHSIPREDQDFFRWLEDTHYYDVERYWLLKADPERYQHLKDTWKDETLFWEELTALAAERS